MANQPFELEYDFRNIDYTDATPYLPCAPSASRIVSESHAKLVLPPSSYIRAGSFTQFLQRVGPIPQPLRIPPRDGGAIFTRVDMLEPEGDYAANTMAFWSWLFAIAVIETGKHATQIEAITKASGDKSLGPHLLRTFYISLLNHLDGNFTVPENRWVRKDDVAAGYVTLANRVLMTFEQNNILPNLLNTRATAEQTRSPYLYIYATLQAVFNEIAVTHLQGTNVHVGVAESLSYAETWACTSFSEGHHYITGSAKNTGRSGTGATKRLLSDDLKSFRAIAYGIMKHIDLPQSSYKFHNGRIATHTPRTYPAVIDYRPFITANNIIDRVSTCGFSFTVNIVNDLVGRGSIQEQLFAKCRPAQYAWMSVVKNKLARAIALKPHAFSTVFTKMSRQDHWLSSHVPSDNEKRAAALMGLAHRQGKGYQLDKDGVLQNCPAEARRLLTPTDILAQQRLEAALAEFNTARFQEELSTVTTIESKLTYECYQAITRFIDHFISLDFVFPAEYHDCLIKSANHYSEEPEAVIEVLEKMMDESATPKIKTEVTESLKTYDDPSALLKDFALAVGVDIVEFVPYSTYQERNYQEDARYGNNTPAIQNVN